MIYKDLRPAKEQIVQYIEKVNWAGPPVEVHLDCLREICLPMNVDHAKLAALLRSQLMCGNDNGALKIINRLPDQRFNGWGMLLVSPIVLPFRLLDRALFLPFRFIRWIVRNT